MSSQANSLHNRLEIITSEHTKEDRNHNRPSFDKSVVFERLESHKSDILLGGGMNGSLCQRAVNTEEPTGSTYEDRDRQQLRKTH